MVAVCRVLQMAEVRVGAGDMHAPSTTRCCQLIKSVPTWAHLSWVLNLPAGLEVMPAGKRLPVIVQIMLQGAEPQ
jgi:hypothetical protein